MAKRYLQPQGNAQIDRSNLLGKNAICTIVGGQSRDLAGGRSVTIGAGGSTSVTTVGKAIRGSGSADVASVPLDLIAYQAVTVHELISVDSWKTSGGQYDMLFELTADGGGTAGGFAFYNGGSSGEQIVVGVYGSHVYSYRSYGRPATNEFIPITLSLDKSVSPNVFRLFIDKQEWTPTQDFGSSGSIAGFANSTLYLLSRNNASLPTTGSLPLLHVVSGASGQAEATAFADNPWQIFKAPSQSLFVAAAGGGSVSGTFNGTEGTETVTSSGSILVGGTLNNTNAAQTVTSSGTVAISGTSSTIEGTETLTASGTVTSGVVGTASITEVAETVTASGSIAIGVTASITPNGQSVVSSGTIAITGTANVYELAETLTASGIALGGITCSADLTQAAQTLSAFATAALSTIGRPSSDVSNSGWTPSAGSDLYAMLDEVTPDDGDYISTSTLGAVCSMALNATQYPGSAAQKLSLRASSSTGNGLSVVIKDGVTTIATRSLTLTPTYDLHTITLTAGEIALISTGALTVEMTST